MVYGFPTCVGWLQSIKPDGHSACFAFLSGITPKTPPDGAWRFRASGVLSHRRKPPCKDNQKGRTAKPKACRDRRPNAPYGTGRGRSTAGARKRPVPGCRLRDPFRFAPSLSDGSPPMRSRIKASRNRRPSLREIVCRPPVFFVSLHMPLYRHGERPQSGGRTFRSGGGCRIPPSRKPGGPSGNGNGRHRVFRFFKKETQSKKERL